MTDTSDSYIHQLLDKLREGDEAAAEQLFRAYEPYLRVVVRRKLSAALRAKFDSADVVQSVWADLLHRFRQSRYSFPDPEHFRAFLVKATQNRFFDHLRRHVNELAQGQPLHEHGADVPASPEPDPSEVLQADELWQRMLSLCSPVQAEALRLRREGFPAAEIAARTGLHEGSVRRIFVDLAQRLAAREGRA
jgi:RNA polymerase sigma factor (sigma-70 family)